MTFKSLHVPTLGLAGVIAMAAAAGPAVADDVVNPVPQTFIPVPTGAANFQPNGAFTSFDISFADPVTGNIFIADRSNAGVDVFSGSSLTFLGRAEGFTGQTGNNNTSGADGVLTVTSGGITTLYAGDGSSTLRVYNATNPAAPVFQQSISTGGTTRVDEMAYSPLTQQILAANNAETPAFGNLFSTNNGHPQVHLIGAPPANQIPVPANLGGFPGGGMEQPAWNPTTGTFFVSIPQLSGGTTGMLVNPNNPGGVAEISTAGKVLRTIDFTNIPGLSSAGCSPSGLAVAGNGNMLVGCNTNGPSQAILLDKNGNFLKLVGAGQLGGTDELWYDPTTNRFYVTGGPGGSNPGTRFFDVVDANGNVLQTINLPTTSSAHSITVDPFNGDVFVALAGTNPAGTNTDCPLGCIAVFAQAAVPAPIVGAGLPGLIFAAGGLVALARRRRRTA
jgi:hypothetical protein